ncbi:alpha/beta fold hydrolase [Salipiger sp.]|uniref:alpha/beta fold hydrolase n=1 Tax=Salipiger sp. TaxID=2078585 RepID=UPI003A983957
MKILNCLIVIAVTCAVAAPIAARAQDLLSTEILTDCFVEMPGNAAPNGGTDCGYVVVPQSHSNPADGQIRLAYMRIRAATQTTAPPLFMLAGGPGQTMIQDSTLLLFQTPFLGPLLNDRDVILMEQRGTFRSKPRLDCPETDGAALGAIRQGLTPEVAKASELDLLRACVARHTAAGVDFDTYNNVESAADVNDVRMALGYEKIFVYGSSYATLLGQYLLRQFPDYLSAVILDGADTVSNRSWIEGRAESAQWGIDNLTGLCSSQPGCAEAFDIPTLIDAVFDLFDEGPIPISFALPDDDGAPIQVETELTAEDFAQFIYALQTEKYGVSALPFELDSLISGGRAAIGEALTGYAMATVQGGDTEGASGMMTLMHAAMVCSDDPVRSLDEIKTDGTGRYATLFAQAAARPYLDLCEVVGVSQLPDDLDAQVEADVPVLILSGGLDVQTPSYLGDDVMRHLPRARQVIFPAGTHVQISNLNRCAMQVMRDFISDPEGNVDLGCVADEQPLAFALPEATDAD